jgi:hypothetical protein
MKRYSTWRVDVSGERISVCRKHVRHMPKAPVSGYQYHILEGAGDHCDVCDELHRQATSPTHTDLMVTPESLETYFQDEESHANTE